MKRDFFFSEASTFLAHQAPASHPLEPNLLASDCSMSMIAANLRRPIAFHRLTGSYVSGAGDGGTEGLVWAVALGHGEVRECLRILPILGYALNRAQVEGSYGYLRYALG